MTESAAREKRVREIVDEIFPFEPNDLRWSSNFLNARIRLREALLSSRLVEMPRVEDIYGCMARAYCVNGNQHKELDANLIMTMAKNIVNFLKGVE